MHSVHSVKLGCSGGLASSSLCGGRYDEDAGRAAGPRARKDAPRTVRRSTPLEGGGESRALILEQRDLGEPALLKIGTVAPSRTARSMSSIEM